MSVQSSRPTFVAVVEPAKNRQRHYFSRSRRLSSPRLRGILCQRKMSARALIIVKITSKNLAQTRLVEHDEMIQALAPNGPDQALNVKRLPWTSRSDEDFCRPHFSDALAEGFAVDSVTIPEEEARSCIPRKSLCELLCRPSSRGMSSHIEMHHSTPLMGQHHKDKQKLESCGGNDEEIHGNHLSEMIGEEVRQVWEGGFVARTMYLAIVVSQTSMPSLSSSP